MKISHEVLGVLSRFQFSPYQALKGNESGHLGIITDGTLDRKLYVATNKVLEELGGKWNKKAKGHLFPEDPTEALEQALELGQIVSAKKELGFFETPLALARQVVDAAEIKPHMLLGLKVLEPSAGTGRLADAVKSVLPTARITCIEIVRGRCGILAQRGYEEVQCYDFLATTPQPNFSRVVMNPTFQKRADLKHVRHAFDWLAPGGILVSIMSGSLAFREDRRTEEFRSFLRAHDGTVTSLPEGSFRESGTEVATVMVKMRRAL